MAESGSKLYLGLDFSTQQVIEWTNNDISTSIKLYILHRFKLCFIFAFNTIITLYYNNYFLLLLQKIKVTVIDESLKVLSEFDSSVSFDDLQKYK